MGVIQPVLSGGGSIGEGVREVGMFREQDLERGAVEDLAGAGEAFSGGGAGDDGEQRLGGISLEHSGAEECEPPVFKVETL